MNAKRLIMSAILLGSVVAFSAGCAKKTADAVPQTTTIPDKEPVQAAPASTPSDDELRAAQRAEAQQAVGNMVFFAFDSFDLTPESRDVLNAKADALKKYNMFNIVIEGHCDERGTSEYNLALGERRAKAAQQFLNQLGIPDSRMTIVSYGKERPLEQGHGEAAWSKNRRDEFKIQN